jgi:hypothetical protein
MLNPFHGVVNVVEVAGADAVSRDGHNWTLYIQGELEYERSDGGRLVPVQTPDVKFANWSAERGLRRAPVRFTTDYARLAALGGELLAAVKASAGAVPFPLTDRYELWLLQAADAAPLALLDSACDAPPADNRPSTRWRAGSRCEQAFRHGPAAGERLGRLVNGAAGSAARAQWFVRAADGGGLGLAGAGLPAELHGRHLPATAFPERLLRADWPEPADALLVEEFLAWQAPWLLQLQQLAVATRRDLERQACGRAAALAAAYRLLPTVVDRGRVTAALVEARLRAAAKTDERPPPVDEPLMPFISE